MLFENQYPHNCSMVIAVLGVPNVGKSSLINAYMGMDLSIVTHRPQTTRNKFKCVALIDHTELIFVDTPGVHLCRQEINIRMNGQARESLPGADVNLLVLDLTRDLEEQVQTMVKYLSAPWKKTWVVFNKMDRAQDLEVRAEIPVFYRKLQEIIPAVEKFFVVSAEREENLHELTAALLDEAPNRRHQFPAGELSNKNEKFFVMEYIRKAAFEILKEEIPYQLAVQVDSFERAEKGMSITATLVVGRASQRAIVIGAGGCNIKTIGTNAREQIERMMRERVYLGLHVKVTSKWFKNNKFLESQGLPRVAESKRVWRQR